MISSQDATAVTLPLYETLSPDNQESTHTPRTDTCFFVKSVELYEIIHQVIQQLYHGAPCKSTKAATGKDRAQKGGLNLGTVLQLDTALGRWERALPCRLKWTSPAIRDPVTHRQAIILSLRLVVYPFFVVQ